MLFLLLPGFNGKIFPLVAVSWAAGAEGLSGVLGVGALGTVTPALTHSGNS